MFSWYPKSNRNSLQGRNVSRWEKGGVEEKASHSISKSLVSTSVIKINSFLWGLSLPLFPFLFHLDSEALTSSQVQAKIWALRIALSLILIWVIKVPGHQNFWVRNPRWTAMLSFKVLSLFGYIEFRASPCDFGSGKAWVHSVFMQMELVLV